MGTEQKIDVIIPTYHPDEKLDKCLSMLKKQTIQPQKILLINTEESLFYSKVFSTLKQGEIIHIKKEEFDHGGTRNLAASMCDGDIMILLTQDAIPADEFLIENLIRPFEQEEVCASYARQLADGKDNPIEAYTRRFNYPRESRIKSREDLPVLGIKTFFCSNVCAAYRKAAYDSMGGFPLHTIFNEDMIFASRLIEAGKKIAYTADARVWHWHNYTAGEQLKRNFDLAVSQVDYGGLFTQVKSESEGIRLVKTTLKHFIKEKKYSYIPKILIQNGAKYLGYKLGQNYKKLPKKMILKLSLNPSYWNGAKT
ncbi:MAG: glycosyltransferase family 2 protein [Eubacterium sp.]|nr:glycosyltransferase family 2 protein [Eubacterium sp.]MDD7209181.1 glycosyltransferase family 2 protein [Lachnospiraceae bacterium]MDY5497077.1 glycosyltransferase family 2 protein [Anaerobutyricum sp.]